MSIQCSITRLYSLVSVGKAIFFSWTVVSARQASRTFACFPWRLLDISNILVTPSLLIRFPKYIRSGGWHGNLRWNTLSPPKTGNRDFQLSVLLSIGRINCKAVSNWATTPCVGLVLPALHYSGIDPKNAPPFHPKGSASKDCTRNVRGCPGFRNIAVTDWADMNLVMCLSFVPSKLRHLLGGLEAYAIIFRELLPVHE